MSLISLSIIFTLFSAPIPNHNSLQEAAKILHQGLSVLQPTRPLHRLLLSMAKSIERVLASVGCWLVLTFGTLYNSLPLNFLDDSGADACFVDKMWLDRPTFPLGCYLNCRSSSSLELGPILVPSCVKAPPPTVWSCCQCQGLLLSRSDATVIVRDSYHLQRFLHLYRREVDWFGFMNIIAYGEKLFLNLMVL